MRVTLAAHFCRKPFRSRLAGMSVLAGICALSAPLPAAQAAPISVPSPRLTVNREAIEQEAERLQSLCDHYRAALKDSFAASVIDPVKADLDQVLEKMTPAELRRLNGTVEAVWSGSQDARTTALRDADAILRNVLSRTQTPLKSEVRVLRHESAPVSPWMLATRHNVPWIDGKSYRVNITFYGLPNEGGYVEKLAVSEESTPLKDVPQSNSIQPIVEKVLNYTCVALPTKQDLASFYAIKLENPINDGVNDLSDAERVISDLNRNRDRMPAAIQISNQPKSKPLPQIVPDLAPVPLADHSTIGM